MNQRHLYEQTIAGKLEALPLPDMADAIWSRIEGQLDIDMPTDDGPDGDNDPHSPAPRIIIGSIAFVFLVAFISFFFFSKNNNQHQRFNDAINPPAQNQEQFLKPADPPKETNAKREEKSARNISPQQNLSVDSAVIEPTPGFVDSPTVINNAPQIAVPAPLIVKPPDSLPPGKKRKGVSGISDSDYRIVPKSN